MKTVYISSPYKGDEETRARNMAYAVELMEFALTNGEAAPIVPHLYFPQVLDDSMESDRDLAMRCSEQFLKNCDLMICGLRYGISEGMEEEIANADELDIPIVWIDAKPENLVGILDHYEAKRRADDRA